MLEYPTAPSQTWPVMNSLTAAPMKSTFVEESATFSPYILHQLFEMAVPDAKTCFKHMAFRPGAMNKDLIAKILEIVNFPALELADTDRLADAIEKIQSVNPTMYTVGVGGKNYSVSGSGDLDIKTTVDITYRAGGMVTMIRLDETYDADDVTSNRSSVEIISTHSAPVAKLRALAPEICKRPGNHREVGTAQIAFIVAAQKGLRLVHRDIRVENDLPDCATADLRKALLKTAKDKMESRGAGLILLHGDPGTGKTSWIKALVRSMPNRTFIWITPDYFSELMTPNFASLILSSVHDEPVFIVEDAEKLLMERGGAESGSGISTLLNLGNGILGDVLGAPVICSFNMDEQNIDSALKRNKRLLLSHRFEHLTKDDVNSILVAEGIDEVTAAANSKKGLTMADTFELVEQLKAGNDDAFKVATKNERPAFGFAAR